MFVQASATELSIERLSPAKVFGKFSGISNHADPMVDASGVTGKGKTFAGIVWIPRFSTAEFRFEEIRERA